MISAVAYCRMNSPRAPKTAPIQMTTPDLSLAGDDDVDVAEGQPAGHDRERWREQPQHRRGDPRVAEAEPGGDLLSEVGGDGGQPEGDADGHQQAGHPEQVDRHLDRVRDDLALGVEIAAPLGVDGVAQVPHPGGAGVQAGDQTDNADRGVVLQQGDDPRLDRLDRVGVNTPELGGRQVRDCADQIRPQLHHQEPQDRERHHDHRDDRQHREVGDTGAELIAEPAVVALHGTLDVGDPADPQQAFDPALDGLGPRPQPLGPRADPARHSIRHRHRGNLPKREAAMGRP